VGDACEHTWAVRGAGACWGRREAPGLALAFFLLPLYRRRASAGAAPGGPRC